MHGSQGPSAVSVSVGCAVLLPPSSEGREGPHSLRSAALSKVAQDLLARADESLYAAKEAGRGRAAAARFMSWPPSFGAAAPPLPESSRNKRLGRESTA